MTDMQGANPIEAMQNAGGLDGPVQSEPVRPTVAKLKQQRETAEELARFERELTAAFYTTYLRNRCAALEALEVDPADVAEMDAMRGFTQRLLTRRTIQQEVATRGNG
jgi:hypothetical protein